MAGLSFLFAHTRIPLLNTPIAVRQNHAAADLTVPKPRLLFGLPQFLSRPGSKRPSRASIVVPKSQIYSQANRLPSPIFSPSSRHLLYILFTLLNLFPAFLYASKVVAHWTASSAGSSKKGVLFAAADQELGLRIGDLKETNKPPASRSLLGFAIPHHPLLLPRSFIYFIPEGQLLHV